MAKNMKQDPKSTFKKDSIQFRKDEKAYNANHTYQNEAKVVGAIKKYGTTKLTGKPTYKLSDMIMSDATKTKKKGGAIKKYQPGGEQDSSRKFKIGKTTISANKKTIPGDASFPSMTKKSVGITRIGKGVTFEKDKLGNGSYGKSITKYSTVKKTGGSIKTKKK